MKKCPHCNKDYESVKAIQIYCSAKCNEKARCKRYYNKNKERILKRLKENHHDKMQKEKV